MPATRPERLALARQAAHDKLADELRSAGQLPEHDPDDAVKAAWRARLAEAGKRGAETNKHNAEALRILRANCDQIIADLDRQRAHTNLVVACLIAQIRQIGGHR
jgi:hypothetical protein